MNTISLQAAMTAGGVVQLPPGETRIEPTLATGNPDRLSDIHLRAPVTLLGDSDGTSRLRMIGGVGMGARSMFDAIAGRLTLARLTIDGTDRQNLKEQVHLVTVSTGGSLLLEDANITLPPLDVPGSGGDGIKIVGGADVVIRRVKFDRCDRSGISIHHGADIKIQSCTFVGTGDADIDIEPPSDLVVRNVTIEDITVTRSRPGDALQLTRCADVVVRRADLGGGNVAAISATGLHLDEVTNAGSVLVRRGGNVLLEGVMADAIRVEGDNVGIPRGVMVHGSTARLINVDSAESVYLVGCTGDVLVWRSVLCRTSGGHLGGHFGEVYHLPRDKGLAWVVVE